MGKICPEEGRRVLQENVLLYSQLPVRHTTLGFHDKGRSVRHCLQEDGVVAIYHFSLHSKTRGSCRRMQVPLRSHGCRKGTGKASRAEGRSLHPRALLPSSTVGHPEPIWRPTDPPSRWGLHRSSLPECA
jgi:hypothetical protein